MFLAEHAEKAENTKKNCHVARSGDRPQRGAAFNPKTANPADEDGHYKPSKSLGNSRRRPRWSASLLPWRPAAGPPFNWRADGRPTPHLQKRGKLANSIFFATQVLTPIDSSVWDRVCQPWQTQWQTGKLILHFPVEQNSPQREIQLRLFPHS